MIAMCAWLCMCGYVDVAMYVWLCMCGCLCMAMYVWLCMHGFVCMAMYVPCLPCLCSCFTVHEAGLQIL